ncbi:MAG: 5-oxoprolinase subunit PxpA [Thermodesulfobacteriota bacterium]
MKSIDLNCDMGESFGKYHLGVDEEIIRHITSANIACGWHAGDPLVMDRTVKLAVENGVGVGAHPSYPDLLGFGRRNMDCTPQEIRQYVTYQVGALQAFCRAHSTRLKHVKPHGALYHRAVTDKAAARAVAQAVMDVDPSLCYVALAGEKGATMARVGREMGLKVVYEAFPDRAYTQEGTLLPRQNPGAVIKESGKVTERALEMVLEGRVKTVDGSSTALKVDTLCVHGDTPGAVELANAINVAMRAEGVSLLAMGTDETPE